MFPYVRELELLFANQATARNLITKTVIDTFGKLKESTSIKSINHLLPLEQEEYLEKV